MTNANFTNITRSLKLNLLSYPVGNVVSLGHIFFTLWVNHKQAVEVTIAYMPDDGT